MFFEKFLSVIDSPTNCCQYLRCPRHSSPLQSYLAAQASENSHQLSVSGLQEPKARCRMRAPPMKLGGSEQLGQGEPLYCGNAYKQALLTT